MSSASGCSKSPSGLDDASGATAPTVEIKDPPTTPKVTPTPTFPTPSPDPSPSPSPSPATPLADPAQVQIQGIGSDATLTLNVSAGRKLRVRLIAGIETRKIAGTNKVPNYSRLGLFLSIGSITTPTEMLYNGIYGGGAQLGSPMDFSSELRTCVGKPATCRATIPVRITKPNTDYLCLTQGKYCPWARVDKKVPWTATLEIETDDTKEMAP